MLPLLDTSLPHCHKRNRSAGPGIPAPWHGVQSSTKFHPFCSYPFQGTRTGQKRIQLGSNRLVGCTHESYQFRMVSDLCRIWHSRTPQTRLRNTRRTSGKLLLFHRQEFGTASQGICKIPDTSASHWCLCPSLAC